MENISEIAAIGILSVVFVSVLVIAELMHKFLKVKAEHTRKFAHVAIGLTCVLVPFKFTNHWYLLAGTVVFISYLFYARKRQHLSAIYSVGRESVGDILLSVAIYLNALLVIHYDFERLFYLPLLIMSVADPAAYYGGQYFKKANKSWQGSAFFAVTAFVASWLYLSFFATATYEYQLPLLMACAVFGAVVEHFSKKGWDNLTVPLAVAGLLAIYFEII